MRLDAARQAGAVRLSWCHLSLLPDTARMVEALKMVHG
jgi:hypothetical protein